MLSHEENELLTGTGPRTAMGEVMRRYWIPAGWSAKLPSRMARRCASVYWAKISWRSATATAGSGPLDEYCPHRRAALCFGRNEGYGLRCVYHDWKFAVDGACVDQMNDRARHRYGAVASDRGNERQHA